MAEAEQIGDILDSQYENSKNVSSDEGNEKLVKKHGGAREGAGRKPGGYNQKTLDQMKVKEAVNQRIMNWADRLINAQMSLAVGEQVLMVRVKDRNSEGKVTRVYHEVVEDIELIKQYLDYSEGSPGAAESPHDEDHYYYLTTRPANNQALDSLLNRALGKAPDKLEVSGGFFDQNSLKIEVVNSKHDDLDIGTAAEPTES